MRSFALSLLIAVQRSRKDARSRRFLLGVAAVTIWWGLVVCAELFVVYKEWAIARIYGLAFLALIFGSGLIAMYLFRRGHRADQGTLNLTPPPRRDVDELIASGEVLQFVADRTVITAALMCRGFSESQLQTADVKFDEVHSRLVLNDPAPYESLAGAGAVRAAVDVSSRRTLDRGTEFFGSRLGRAASPSSLDARVRLRDRSP